MLANQLIAEPVVGGFRALPSFHGEWRKRLSLRAIPSNLTIATEAGLPTVPFMGVCRSAFPLKKPPNLMIVERDGRATDYFVDWINR